MALIIPGGPAGLPGRIKEIVYVEPRFNTHEIYYGTYLMVNGKYVSHNSVLGNLIMEKFGWKPDYMMPRTVESYWEKFTDWLFYRYPIGLWIEGGATACLIQK